VLHNLEYFLLLGSDWIHTFCLYTNSHSRRSKQGIRSPYTVEELWSHWDCRYVAGYFL